MNNRKRTRDTSFTQILSVLSNDKDDSWNLKDDKEKNQFQFIVASNLSTRKRAYQLTYDIYHDLGYAENENKMIVSKFDADEDTLTLLIKNHLGEDIATIGLYVDNEESLPCDKSFSEEINFIRSNNLKIAEVTRLAIKKEYRNSKLLITRMFNFIYLYSYKILNVTDLVIEVKSKHASYYSKLLDFEILGKEKPVEYVNNTLARILHIPLSRSAQQIPSSIKNINVKKNLYRQFYSVEEEKPVLNFLRKNLKPITHREKIYFGLIDKVHQKTEDPFESELFMAI